MIKIMKASAGSGKTFSLAKEYIELLLTGDDEYAYRHILAVTFTNKATEEMKQRILDELDLLAARPEESKYLAGIMENTGKSADFLSRLAKRILHNILNDYSAFSVSTIDKFFQRTLKAFAREIGQFASYQIELDKNSLVTESVDRILDSLTEDSKVVLDWLTDSVMDQIMSTGRFSLDKELYETAVSLNSEDYRTLVEQKKLNEADIYSRKALSELRKACRAIISDYVKGLRNASDHILEIICNAGLSVKDFNRGFLSALYKYSELKDSDPVQLLTPSFVSKASDPQQWFAKSKSPKLLPKVEGMLEEPLAAFVGMFGERFFLYNTARILAGQIYSLGLADEIHKSFNALMKEKNVLCLDDSNTILKDIIDGSDAPFIYEKIGVRFDHFLLDEFQDTSAIQWENFRPLLEESNSRGNENLIVGDVKQSIYRWRNSDWNLLNKELVQEFPDSSEETLDSNWRSHRSIVEFNNGFYSYAAAYLDESGGTQDHEISGIYSDVQQKVRSKDTFPGNVDVIFCQNGKDTDEEMPLVIAEIVRLRESGAAYSDIGILVRTNGIGSAIATALLESNIPVVSDDSLTVKSSPSVRRLTALLSYANNPEDKLNSFLASSLSVEPPEEYHSLVDLCEYFIRAMKIDFEGEVPYIQAFMDTVQDWSQTHGNSLQEFISYWDTVDPKISSPENTDAVRIMTIHKSKGLAFNYVIFPYTEEIDLYKPVRKWCCPDIAGTELSNVAYGIYRVSLSAGTECSYFAQDYRNERLMQLVDAMNTYYVATTRAKYGMTLISAVPPKAFLDSEDAVPKTMSHILYNYVCNTGGSLEWKTYKEELPSGDCTVSWIRYRLGEAGTFCRKDRNVLFDNQDRYISYPLNPKTEDGGKARLEFSTEASDFFSTIGTEGIGASERLRGIVMHDILSKVIVPSDLERAIDESFNAGEIDMQEQKKIKELLSDRIQSALVRGWFPEDRRKVYNETSVFDREGENYRPDRVIIDGSTVTIVDYKFGHHEPKYIRQINTYARLYRDMGYDNVTAHLWYVYENKVVTCTGAV